MSWHRFVGTTVLLYGLINPVGAIPIFLHLVQTMPAARAGIDRCIRGNQFYFGGTQEPISRSSTLTKLKLSIASIRQVMISAMSRASGPSLSGVGYANNVSELPTPAHQRKESGEDAAQSSIATRW
jgi:hypothetical protein